MSRRTWRACRSLLPAAASAFALALMAAQAEAQSPPVSPDDFVAAASGADQYEVMAARLALVESRNPAIRGFASEMVRDHTAARMALQAAAARSGLKPPSSSVGGDQTQLLAALQGLRGADFDRAYVRQQGLAHRQALTTERSYARGGSDANLRAAAAADVPMIEHHLQAVGTLPQ